MLQLTKDDLDVLRMGTIVLVVSPVVGLAHYKRTKAGWRTFNPKTGRPNGKPLASDVVAERVAYLEG